MIHTERTQLIAGRKREPKRFKPLTVADSEGIYTLPFSLSKAMIVEQGWAKNIAGGAAVAGMVVVMLAETDSSVEAQEGETAIDMEAVIESANDFAADLTPIEQQAINTFQGPNSELLQLEYRILLSAMQADSQVQWRYTAELISLGFPYIDPETQSFIRPPVEYYDEFYRMLVAGNNSVESPLVADLRPIFRNVHGEEAHLSLAFEEWTYFLNQNSGIWDTSEGMYTLGTVAEESRQLALESTSWVIESDYAAAAVFTRAYLARHAMLQNAAITFLNQLDPQTNWTVATIPEYIQVELPKRALKLTAERFQISPEYGASLIHFAADINSRAVGALAIGEVPVPELVMEGDGGADVFLPRHLIKPNGAPDYFFLANEFNRELVELARRGFQLSTGFPAEPYITVRPNGEIFTSFGVADMESIQETIREMIEMGPGPVRDPAPDQFQPGMQVPQTVEEFMRSIEGLPLTAGLLLLIAIFFIMVTRRRART